MCIDKDTYTHLIILIMKFLEEEKFKESLQALEQEWKIFFNMNHLGEIIKNGEWEMAEKYVSAFTKLDDNWHSKKLFFELGKQKYYEALCRDDHSGAVNIWLKDLEVFSVSQKRVDGELAELFSLKDLRLEQETKVFFNMNYFGECITSGKWDNAEKYLSAFTKMDDNSFSVKMFSEMQRRKYLDVEAVDRQKLPSESVGRAHFYNAFKVLVEKNPILQDKLKFPCLDKSRLLKLIKQIMDWWVPYRVNMMPHTKNDSISLKHIPTVPYLIPASSFVINNSSQEGDFLPASSGDSSNYSSCFTDVHHSTESTSLADANSLVCKKPTDKSVIWKLQQINEPSECRTLMLPDNSLGERVVQLVYSSSVDFILALTQNSRHKLWRLQSNKHSVLKENANMEPQLYQPSSGILMTNDIAGDPKDAAPCFALNSYLFSASGGKISVFSLDTFETLATFANPPPTATYFIFIPQDLFAIGFDDSSILIHCPYTKKTKAKLKGHRNRITCLAFSHNLNVLISSGADAKLCVWDANGWKKLCSKFLQSFRTGLVLETPVVNHIQFHPDQIHLLSTKGR